MKRFTESTKWDDKWFRRLPADQKFGWLYLLDTCDAAGVVEIDTELAEFRIGMPVNWEGLLKDAGTRIEPIAKGKHWLTGYIKFQYGTLSRECNAHRPAFASLEKHTLVSRVLEGSKDPFLKGPIQDKDKDKDKEGGCKGETETPHRFVKPTVQTVADYALGKGYHFSPEAFVAHYESNGWRVGKNPMRSWRQACVTWEQGWKEKQPKMESRLATAEDIATWTP